ncbi:MAG: FAD:protein FMN transferase [Oceanospirillaceae bacterium]|nr:FAD:protein FMN transferase [Oceanospirillaceae bacterium]
MLTMLLGCSASQAPKIEAITGLSMGTSYTVKWVQSADQQNPIDGDIASGVALELGRIEASMSTYMDASDLSGFNGATTDQWHSVPAPMAELVSQALSLSEQTNGAFDITVGPIVNLWGFGPDPVPENSPTQAALDALRPMIGYQSLKVQKNPPAMLKLANSTIDLSAIAKGYGVDAVATWLESKGLDNYLIEVGGELRAKGLKPDHTPWRIAIETPTVDARQIYQVINVRNIAVATSGNYRNYYELDGVRYAHTLDPHTLRPVTHNLASVTVLDASAARADALATALMVMGSDKGIVWATMHQVPAYFIMKQLDGFVAQSTANFTDFLEN